MKKQDGIILVTAVVVFLVVSILTIAFLSLIYTYIKIPIAYLNSAKALYIAEAGISDAIRYIGGGGDFSITEEFADGDYRATGEVLGDDSWILTSIGSYKDSQKSVRVELEIDEGIHKIIGWQEA